MKRSVIVVGILSIGIIILSTVGITLYQTQIEKEQENDFDFHYLIDFDYYENETTASIEMQIEGNNLTFNQIIWVYCNAYYDSFWLEITSNDSTIIIQEIFDSNSAAKCHCPIKISGAIYNISSYYSKIQFVYDNRYVDQVLTIDTFNISF